MDSGRRSGTNLILQSFQFVWLICYNVRVTPNAHVCLYVRRNVLNAPNGIGIWRWDWNSWSASFCSGFVFGNKRHTGEHFFLFFETYSFSNLPSLCTFMTKSLFIHCFFTCFHLFDCAFCFHLLFFQVILVVILLLLFLLPHCPYCMAAAAALW